MTGISGYELELDLWLSHHGVCWSHMEKSGWAHEDIVRLAACTKLRHEIEAEAIERAGSP